MRKDKQEIVFIRKNDFQDSNKLTILSATADRTLYRDYFSGKKVYFRETHKAEYKGKLIQYTAHPLSRAFFKKNGMMDIVNQIQDEYIKDIPIISFKMLFPSSEIHFGKTEGFNTYKGLDIAVIGTPHNSPILYKLVTVIMRTLPYHPRNHCALKRLQTAGKKQVENPEPSLGIRVTAGKNRNQQFPRPFCRHRKQSLKTRILKRLPKRS